MTPANAHWERLLVWLQHHGMKIDAQNLLVECRSRTGAGNGLFAMQKCSPSRSLFRVPASALVNIKTLSPHYPCPLERTLTATQLISLHLSLYRPSNLDEESSDPLFGPYISILPRDFEAHPLSWLVKQGSNAKDRKETECKLLQALPPSTMVALQSLENRFHNDLKAVRDYLNHPEVLVALHHDKLDLLRTQSTSLVFITDFLWGWLNVNTRCIYHRLKYHRSDPDNLTLCPILDFANHTPNLPHMSPLSTSADIWSTAPYESLGNDLEFLSPHDTVTEKGQEIYLTYGPHCNRTLFVEYGFVNQSVVVGADSFNGEVDVQDLVEGILGRDGIAGQWTKSFLEEEGYWGDWTLHLTPEPAHPSFRLIAALRLCHVNPPLTPTAHPREIENWQGTLMGRRDTVSDENERAWRNTLLEICTTLIDRGTRQKAAIVAATSQDSSSEWPTWMWGNILQLWNEEVLVATAVSQSVRDGVEF